MEQKVKHYECKDCKYFLQHYTYTRGNLFKVNCGHCINKLNGRFRKTNNICEEFTLLTKKQVLKNDKATLENKIDYILSDLEDFKKYFQARQKRENWFSPFYLTFISSSSPFESTTKVDFGLMSFVSRVFAIFVSTVLWMNLLSGLAPKVTS